MNKKAGAIAIVIVLILLVGVGAVVYTLLIPPPNPSYNPSTVSTTGMAVASSNVQSSDSGNCGGYGESCCQGEYCDYGECQNGVCVHCGSFGETCCFKQSDYYQCEYGSSCVSGRCRVDSDYYYDCGMIGYPPCSSGCYYGVYNYYKGICEACGDYEQPCCLNTYYECDYGKCVNGICKKESLNQAGTSSQSSSGSQTNTQEGTQAGSSASSSNENCGYLNQKCCETGLYQDSWGSLRNDQYCKDNLDCRAGVCVKGPVYEAYDRTRGY